MKDAHHKIGFDGAVAKDGNGQGVKLVVSHCLVQSVTQKIREGSLFSTQSQVVGVFV